MDAALMNGSQETIPEPRVTEAVLTRLADLGPPSEVRGRSPAIAADALHFDRVLLTSITGGTLRAEALYTSSGTDSGETLARLRETPVALEYPLIEGEIMRRRRAQLVRATDGASARARAFAEVLGWIEYVTAPIVLDGRVLGFFHADKHSSGQALVEDDASALSMFALCFGLTYERAVLRHRLRVQVQEMNEIAGWAVARTSELGDRSVTLSEVGDVVKKSQGPVANNHIGEEALRDLLTPRELDVLRLLVRGNSNAEIAKELVISEGTVKYHVKNILRKLHASNRADATSRYLRLTLNHAPTGADRPG